jgi:hypothetical protein
MPGAMNVVSLTKVVRERWPGVRIVIILGRLNPGPDDNLPEDIVFLTKPFLPTTLVNLLRQIITPQIIDPASSGS